MGKEEVLERRLDVQPGKVLEIESLKEFAAFLERDAEMYQWWRMKMGFEKE